jgi:Uma2 family endonuclease
LLALDRHYADAHPVAIEILRVVEVADTSLAYDRDIKLPLYARCGIPQAWIVDVDTRCLTVYREPSAEGYRRVATLETDEAVEVCGVSLPGMELLAKGQCLTR